MKGEVSTKGEAACCCSGDICYTYTSLLLQGGEVGVEALGVHAALRAVAARRVTKREGDGAHPMGHLVRVRLRVR
eukprot:scaffold73061_cov30-Phaeocystis_antarctica.AAC.1